MSLKRRAPDKEPDKEYVDNGLSDALPQNPIPLAQIEPHADVLVSRDTLKALIHDMNNALMLIGITAEQLEQRARKADKEAEQAGAHDPASDKTYYILRRNINEMREMLVEIAHIMPQALTHKGALSSFADKDLGAFLADQKADWLLLALPETQITIEVEPFQGNLLVVPAYLTRILNNLMRNACEAYMRLGPAQKDASAACEIALHARAEEGRLLIFIGDNGPGIQEDREEDIFRPYCSTKGQSDLPTGIGLTNARKLAAQMGGDLALVSTDERPDNSKKGALFMLSFPLHRA